MPARVKQFKINYFLVKTPAHMPGQENAGGTGTPSRSPMGSTWDLLAGVSLAQKPPLANALPSFLDFGNLCNWKMAFNVS